MIFQRPRDRSFEAYPGGIALVPDDLRGPRVAPERGRRPPRRRVGVPRSDGAIHRARQDRCWSGSVVIAGVTIVFGPPGAPDEQLVLRRYVDWADVWAQLGRVSRAAASSTTDQDQSSTRTNLARLADEPGDC